MPPSHAIASGSFTGRHGVPAPPTTNIVMTFYGRPDGTVVLHAGAPASADMAQAGGVWSQHSTWILQTSTDLVSWATVSATNVPGSAVGTVTVTNGWEGARFFRIGWR